MRTLPRSRAVRRCISGSCGLARNETIMERTWKNQRTFDGNISTFARDVFDSLRVRLGYAQPEYHDGTDILD